MRTAALLALVLAYIIALPVIAAPDDPNDPVALEHVWANTLVIFPDRPKSLITRGRNLDQMLERRPVGQKLPVVIFAHGCSGLHMHSTQVSRMIHDIAAAGFVVFAPDSLARPVETYCDPVALKSRIGFNEIQGRIAEVDMVRDRISKFGWIDANNLFLAGHSMGGITVNNHVGSGFRAMAILGYHCGPHRHRQLEGLKAAFEMPIISVIGDRDEWFINGPNRGINCGHYMRNYPHAKSIVYPGIPHDVSQHPQGMNEIVAFFRKHATRDIQPVTASSVVATTRYDGQWSGRMECTPLKGGAPFINIVNLAVANGVFQWRTQVPAGLRGFNGTITDEGEFSAAGYIGKGGLLEDVKSAAENTEVQWAIVFGGLVNADTIETDGGWGANPCKMTLRRAA